MMLYLNKIFWILNSFKHYFYVYKHLRVCLIAGGWVGGCMGGWLDFTDIINAMYKNECY